MSGSRIRLDFAGTPELAAIVLTALAGNRDYAVRQVYTQPDRPAGRGRKFISSAVKQTAQRLQLPIRQPVKPSDIDPADELSEVDFLVVTAYGMLLPEAVLQRPRFGCINVHTSLLPRWRGAAPIQRAIQAGDRESGITIMQMDSGLDTGDIVMQERCPIMPDDTGGSLHDRLAGMAPGDLDKALKGLAAGRIQPLRQDEALATYARKISKEEARIDWSRPAGEIERMIRAFNPYPVACTEINGLTVRIWEAQISGNQPAATPGTITACDPMGLTIQAGDRELCITRLQIPGKKPLAIREFLNGHPGFSGKAA